MLNLDLFKRTLNVLHFNFTMFGGHALANNVAVFNVERDLLTDRSEFIKYNVFLLNDDHVMMNLLSFFVRRLLHVLRRRLPIPSVSANKTSAIAGLGTIRRQSARTRPSHLAPIVLRLITREGVHVFTVAKVVMVTITMTNTRVRFQVVAYPDRFRRFLLTFRRGFLLLSLQLRDSDVVVSVIQEGSTTRVLFGHVFCFESCSVRVFAITFRFRTLHRIRRYRFRVIAHFNRQSFILH